MFGESNPMLNRKDIWLNREARLQIYLPPDWKIVDSRKDSMTLEKAADKLSTKFRLLPPQTDHDPRKLFSGEPLKATAIADLQELKPVHHKVPAFSAFATLDTENGPRMAYTAVLYQEKYTILLTGMPKDDAWLKTHRYIFDAQANLAKVLSDEEYAQRQLKRLHSVEAKAGDTYADLARQGPLGEAGERYLRLLNRQYPSGEPAPGQTLKIVTAEP